MLENLAERLQPVLGDDDRRPSSARLRDPQVLPLGVFLEIKEELLVLDLEVFCFQHLVQNRLLRPARAYEGGIIMEFLERRQFVEVSLAYLDHHATTPPDPEVVAGMIPYLREVFGNPSSVTHERGREARDAVEEARGEVAQLLDAEPSEIVFTSCATESNNLALKGSAWALRGEGDHIVASG